MLTVFKNPELRQYAAVIIGNFTTVLLGLHIVWGSPMLIKFRDPDQTILNRPPTEDEEAWIVSISQLSGIFTLLTTGSLVSYFGRKKVILMMFIPRITMCLFVIFGNEVWMLLVGRAIGGVADLTCLSAVSTYASEVASKKIRGASGTVTQIMSATGMMIMFAVGPYASYLAVNLVMTAIVVGVYIPMLFIPESPYFLYAKGRTNDAVEVLILLRGSEEAAHEEIKEYAAIPENDTKVDKKSLFKDKVVIKTFVLVIILSFGLNANGYNAVNFYLQTIFESAQTSISSELSSLIVGVIQLIASCTTFLLTDRFGRKPILCIAMIGMFVGMVGLGTFFVLLENSSEITGFLNFLPLLSIIFVFYGFNAGMGSLFWIVVAELFEGPVRPYGVSCGMLIGAVGSFSISYMFPGLLSSIGPAVMYYIFSGFCLMVCAIIFFFVPETKGKSFAEIQIALGRKDVRLANIDEGNVSTKKNDDII